MELAAKKTSRESEFVMAYASQLTAGGFTVILPNRDEPSSWGYFWKDGNLGYFDCDRWGAFNFSTRHKANRRCGTGFGVHSRIYNPTVRHAEQALERPSMFNSYQVEYYKSVEELISHSQNKWCNLYILNTITE
jgi:hypothetical protein